jgi:hypothetical protein
MADGHRPPASDCRIINPHNRNHRMVGRCAMGGWAADFLFAGTSALLLLIVNIFESYWYLSLLAILPFTYKISKASLKSSIRLGLILGLSFFGTLAIDLLLLSPFRAGLRIFVGGALFALLGGSIGYVRRRWGFNPLLIALIWTGYEWLLIKLGLISSLFGSAEMTLPLFNTLSTIFGFLIVSLIIVLTNSLMLLAIQKTITLLKTGQPSLYYYEPSWKISFDTIIAIRNLSLIPEGRAPPKI